MGPIIQHFGIQKFDFAKKRHIRESTQSPSPFGASYKFKKGSHKPIATNNQKA
jgi:hypothetical protein